MTHSSSTTPQEEFWAGTFGDDYIDRNDSSALVAGKTAAFAQILTRTAAIQSVAELGCNVGINLQAIRHLLPAARLEAVEINEKAADLARQRLESATVVTGSLFDYEPSAPVDLAFTCGVMIHLEPKSLPRAYERLAAASSRYVAIAEYYNPSPMTLPYRGNDEKLFKRDFAGEFMDAHPEYRLLDYGFFYRRDGNFPLDDITWFLMEK
ncbi:MAG: pseudaminic acid biosynthesis-associated methylase [Planctomycetota bacterium]